MCVEIIPFIRFALTKLTPIKLEMEIPKVLWLKNHMPSSSFGDCQFFDLPDYLTYRATSSLQRSACSLVCKCSYLPESGWQAGFFEKIGLSELVQSHYRQLGDNEVLTAGRPVGKGLTRQSASDLGLTEGTPVGSAVIDALVAFSDYYTCKFGLIELILVMRDGWVLSQLVTIPILDLSH